MIDGMLTLSNVRVAGIPTFFPGSDPKRHRCLVTVIKNRGKNRNTGQDMTETYGLVFWGNYAQVAANYLTVGRAINVLCTPRSWDVDTGRVKANGKKEMYRTAQFHVVRFEFGADSKKELVKMITENIQKAKAEGLLPAETTITADYLIARQKKQFLAYNGTVDAQGLYGNARVFIKGAGWLQPGASAPAPAAAAPAGDLAAQVANLTQMIANIQSGNAAPAAAQAVDPFEGAA
jgi:hypothetical protein